MKLLGAIMRYFGARYYKYIDETQLYCSTISEKTV